MQKFVWDTSAIVNIKEPNEHGYSPGHSFFKDLADGWIDIEHLNIFPTLAIFEVSATLSKLHRKGSSMLREFYLINEHSQLYDVNSNLVDKAHELFTIDGFDKLYGADLVFACIAKVENACLVTMDRKLALHASQYVKVIDLNESRNSPKYRDLFDK